MRRSLSPPQHSLLRRRTPYSSPTQSHEPISYISLKDLLPSMVVNSPRPMMPQLYHQDQSPGSDISIRNRLVKQAAWAYLQPMSTSPASAGSSGPFSALVGFIDRHIVQPLVQAFDWLFRASRVRSSR